MVNIDFGLLDFLAGDPFILRVLLLMILLVGELVVVVFLEVDYFEVFAIVGRVLEYEF